MAGVRLLLVVPFVVLALWAITAAGSTRLVSVSMKPDAHWLWGVDAGDVRQALVRISTTAKACAQTGRVLVVGYASEARAGVQRSQVPMFERVSQRVAQDVRQYIAEMGIAWVGVDAVSRNLDHEYGVIGLGVSPGRITVTIDCFPRVEEIQTLEFGQQCVGEGCEIVHTKNNFDEAVQRLAACRWPKRLLVVGHSSPEYQSHDFDEETGDESFEARGDAALAWDKLARVVVEDLVRSGKVWAVDQAVRIEPETSYGDAVTLECLG
jgi:hypothetical protein